jgi:2-polyprenyl-3-methyl-5-hydroxy-6-metoxy-1,4-benzoquinol methylase
LEAVKEMSIIDIQKLTTRLKDNGDGLWVAYDQTDVSYPRNGNESCLSIENNSFWFRHRNSVITSLVKAFFPDGAVFDVGGGNGYVAIALQSAGIETILVEPGAQGSRNAKARGLNVVIQSTLEDCEFRDRTIPAFGLFDVLEHIENDSEFLHRLYGQLLPKGYLYVTVPAYNFLWSIDDDYAQHYRRYTVRTLTKRLESVGFTVRYCSYFFCVLMPAVFVFRSIPSRFRIRRSIDLSSIKEEHAERAGLARFILEQTFAYELGRIEKRRYLATGSSCVAVAQKVP